MTIAMLVLHDRYARGRIGAGIPDAAVSYIDAINRLERFTQKLLLTDTEEGVASGAAAAKKDSAA